MPTRFHGPLAALAILVACQAASACGDRRATLPRGTLRFADILNLDVRDVPLLMALDALEAQGYAVEKRYLSSGALIVDLMVRDAADVGLVNNQTMWTAIARGARVRTIAQFTASTTVVAARDDIRSCDQLDGRRLGVPTTSGLSPALMWKYFSERCAGAKPQILVILESAARSAALVSGTIDATVMPGEELLKLQHRNVAVHALASWATEFPDVQIDGLHARIDWLARNPDLARDFLRALIAAHRQVARNPAVLYEEASRRLSIDKTTS
jgi:ABC-type nitrate/sulfonate/bicarbonate transport system substrate-binding protein